MFSEKFNRALQSFPMRTAHGIVRVPIDENWQEYSEWERDRIRQLLDDVILPDREDPETFCFVAELSARQLTEFDSLEQAKAVSDGYVYLEGDWGGQIYFSCPAKYLACDETALRDILKQVDALEWDCNEGNGSDLFYGRAKPGDEIGGGMGGGLVENGPWFHPDLSQKSIDLLSRLLCKP